VGTVDPRVVVGRVWVQLSNPMQDYDVHKAQFKNQKIKTWAHHDRFQQQLE